MKACSRCNKELELADFPLKKSAIDGHGYWCKECQRAYSKEHYTKNSSYYKKKARKHNVSCTKRSKEYIVAYLREHPCVDCGERDIDVLEFDHIEMVRGLGGRIGQYANYSIERLKTEIDKCEVRCANCHARRTRKQMGWFR